MTVTTKTNPILVLTFVLVVNAIAVVAWVAVACVSDDNHHPII